MYEAFFGLRERPFQLTPNPRFLFLNSRHREAFETLRYGLRASPGVTVLVGEAGTGKTTLLLAALSAEDRPANRYALLNNPTLTRAEFYEMLTEGFALPSTSGSKARFLLDFQHNVTERHAAGGTSAIVIDEAQSLPHELFEEVRLLANFETASTKLVNVVLVGQPELAERLNDPTLRQLKQRVSLRWSLAPLDLLETATYIASRLEVAGADPAAVFTKDAVLAIYAASGGVPRTIGVICDNALIGGYAARIKPIERSIVLDVCHDFDLPLNGHAFWEREAAPERAPESVSPGRATRDGPGPAAIAIGEPRAPSAVKRPKRFWFF